jgi:3'-phosphoadenosine 5'-phosphosulfate (PAPS) 3'-phosphatase
MIVKGLKMHFPDIRIIGEESEEFKGDIEFPYSTLRDDTLP